MNITITLTLPEWELIQSRLQVPDRSFDTDTWTSEELERLQTTLNLKLESAKETRSDKERMEWMENNLVDLRVHIPKPNSTKKKRWAANPSINYEYDTFLTLREAIDAKIN